MTKCPHCGANLPFTQDAFCTSCREQLDEPVLSELTLAQKAAVREDGKRELWIVLIGMVILIKAISWVLRLIGEYYHPQ